MSDWMTLGEVAFGAVIVWVGMFVGAWISSKRDSR